MQGTQRYVVFAYLAIGFVLFITLDRIFGFAVYTADLPNPGIIGNRFTLATVIALAISGAVGYFAYKHPKAHQFSNEVVAELRKVTWPGRQETQSSTVVVIVTTLIIAGILGIFDFIWAELTGLIYL